MAKEKIYTIAFKDVYSDLSTCPFCQLEQKVEEDALHYYLGPALMEADVRKETNKSGFCRDHLHKLYASGENRLGLALTLNTHLTALESLLDELCADLEAQDPGSWFARLKGRGSEAAQRQGARLQAQLDACVICERLAANRVHYLDICFDLLQKDPAFEELFFRCTSYCLPHIRMLITAAGQALSAEGQTDFFKKLRTVLLPALRELTADVQWFCEKFDYRNREAPWKNSQDALPRSIQYLGGAIRKEKALTKG